MPVAALACKEYCRVRSNRGLELSTDPHSLHDSELLLLLSADLMCMGCCSQGSKKCYKKAPTDRLRDHEVEVTGEDC